MEVVGLGALNVDHLYRVERILEDGEAVVNELILSPGGSAANTVYGLAKLGVSTGFAGVVGGDAEGRMLLADFDKVAVDTSQVRVRPDTKTGSVVCLSDSTGKRSLYVSPGANSLLTVNDLDLGYLNQATVLHVSSFADDGQFRLSLELMDRLAPSVKVSFAPGTLYAARGLKALGPILARTHVLFLNQHEIHELTGNDFEAGTKTCLKHGCKIIVVTLGKGTSWHNVLATAYIRDINNEYIVEPSGKSTVSSLDTTGAGDAFATGFLYGLLRGKGIDECGRLGDIVAQFSITKVGARQGLPTPDELSQRYHELYDREL